MERAEAFGYYDDDLRTRVFECPSCAWSGGFKDTANELFEAVSEHACPSCHRVLFLVEFPTEEEVLEAAKRGVPEAERQMDIIQGAKEAARERESSRIKDGSGLPDLDGDRLAFVLDLETVEKVSFYLLKHEGKELARERTAFEDYERLEALEALLEARYGPRFFTLTPTWAAFVQLFGDAGKAARRYEQDRIARGLPWVCEACDSWRDALRIALSPRERYTLLAARKTLGLFGGTSFAEAIQQILAKVTCPRPGPCICTHSGIALRLKTARASTSREPPPWRATGPLSLLHGWLGPSPAIPAGPCTRGPVA